MRNKRKVIIKIIESEINNHSLIEYLANKFNERKIENEH